MVLPEFLKNPLVDNLIELSLREDGVDRDLTTLATEAIDTRQTVRATVVAKKPTVAAGFPIVRRIVELSQASSSLTASVLCEEGSVLSTNAPWIIFEGSASEILRLERTFLNFLMRMAGIASHTRAIVRSLEGTNCRLLHTRKTAPGHRITDVYAALVGGAHAHRKSLSEAILVKENHIRTAKSLQHLKDGIAKYRNEAKFVEIEVTNFIELKYAMESKPDRIMLDNFSIADIAKAVTLFGSSVEFEASGSITQETARTYAETGVDYISVGAITHSSPAADLSLLFDFA